MVPGPFRLYFQTQRRSPFYAFGVAALATLPVEFLSQAMGWNMMHPGPYLAEAAWLPVMMLCQLALLRRMGKLLQAGAEDPPLMGRALASALAAELLLSLRFCVVILLWALPALFFLAVFGLEALWARIAFALLALGAAAPCLAYVLRRLFAAPIVLWQGLKAGPALDESARLSQGKLKRILLPLLGVFGISLILEGISGESQPQALILMPVSFMLNSSAVAWAYRILTL